GDLLVVLDRVVLRPDGSRRLAESLEQAFREGGGRAVVEVLAPDRADDGQAREATPETAGPRSRGTTEPVGEPAGKPAAAARVYRYGDRFGCAACESPLERPQPLLFSFNHPLGACPECKGFGNVLKYDEARVVPDPTRTLADGAVEPWTYPSGKWYQRQLVKSAKRLGLDLDTPYQKLSED